VSYWGTKALYVFVLFLLPSAIVAQTNTDSVCRLPQPSFATTTPNIFSDAREQDLGDALAEYVESDLHIAVPTDDDQLTRIGEKLLATLPPTGIKFRFRIYDSGEVNGFSLPGGRVYISRKLVVAVKNEDELAAVLAHEIGHIVTHQSAIEMTRVLKIRLGVTQVNDRADVFAKVHQMMSTPAKSNEGESSEEKGQISADQVGLYAMVQAGYAAESFATFMNDSMSNNGKTGNWVSDMFGLTHEASQRYRRALKLTAALPQECKGKKPTMGDAFAKWKQANVTDRVKLVAAGVTGDKELKLDPPLRQSLWRISFSPDGRYILTQDGGSVTIVDRDSQKVLFMIEAPDANKAQFTPDSNNIVFDDDNLRVERWDIATQKRISVKELVVFDGCTQTVLSSDGKTLACVKVSLQDASARIGVKLIDVDTGKPFFDKPAFKEVFFANLTYYAIEMIVTDILLGRDVVALQITPDSHYLLLGDGYHLTAWDLTTRQPIQLGGKLHGIAQAASTFVGSGELFILGGLKGNGMQHGLLLSFPDGKLLKDIDIGDENFRGVAKGNYLIVGPLKEFEAGILDMDTAKFVGATKVSTIDVFDKWVASESPAGGLQLGQFGTANPSLITLPLSPLPGMRAATISDDGKYLAFSMKNRSAIWNVETGKQILLMRPFRSAWLDEHDRMWGLFPKFGTHDEQEMALTFDPQGEKSFGKFEKDDFQYQNLQLRFKPMGKDKESANKHATLEVKNMETQAVAWTRDFQHETPACWPAEDDRLVLGWDLSNDTAKGEIKLYPELQKQAEAFKDKKKGLLLETVVPETGKLLQRVIIPETDLSGGWNDTRRAVVSGDYVLVRGEHSNTVIYHLDGSGKVGEFFGRPVASDAATGTVIGVNRDNEVLIVDERTGQEKKRFTLGSTVRLASIASDKEKTLLLLTSDQVVHRVPLTN
jgi:Putative Zn-dependent protease, contains TPR repeats